MIETVIKKFLDEKLNVPIYMEHQREEPTRFVIFERTGGSEENKIHFATFAFQSYAESMYEAARLNCMVKNVVNDLVTLPEIGKVKLNNDYNFTDTTTKRYRYQAVFDVVY